MQDPLNGRVVHPASKNKDKGKKFQQIIVTYSQRGPKRRRMGRRGMNWNGKVQQTWLGISVWGLYVIYDIRLGIDGILL